jgi:hypothetical protein
MIITWHLRKTHDFDDEIHGEMMVIYTENEFMEITLGAVATN